MGGKLAIPRIRVAYPLSRGVGSTDTGDSLGAPHPEVSGWGRRKRGTASGLGWGRWAKEAGALPSAPGFA